MQTCNVSCTKGDEMCEENGEQRTMDEPASSAESPNGQQSQDAVKNCDELEQAYDELNDRFLRLAADFENHKKRMAKEIERRSSTAVEQFAADILDVADNLERARSYDNGGLREGLDQIYKSLIAVLERHGITPIESLNTQFDPSVQEAIAYVPSETEEGIVIDEIIRGYRMNEKIIRCAKVAVSRGMSEEE
jgi:molecular chaperone GrpE